MILFLLRLHLINVILNFIQIYKYSILNILKLISYPSHLHLNVYFFHQIYEPFNPLLFLDLCSILFNEIMLHQN